MRRGSRSRTSSAIFAFASRVTRKTGSDAASVDDGANTAALLASGVEEARGRGRGALRRRDHATVYVQPGFPTGPAEIRPPTEPDPRLRSRASQRDRTRGGFQLGVATVNGAKKSWPSVPSKNIDETTVARWRLTYVATVTRIVHGRTERDAHRRGCDLEHADGAGGVELDTAANDSADPERLAERLSQPADRRAELELEHDVAAADGCVRERLHAVLAGSVRDVACSRCASRPRAV